MAVIFVIAIVTFAAGVTVAALALVTWGIRAEERGFTLTSHALDPVTRGTRRVTGLYVRQRTDTAAPQADRQDLFV